MNRRERVARAAIERTIVALDLIDEASNEWADLARAWLDGPALGVAVQLLDLSSLGVAQGPIGSNKIIGTAPCLARHAASALVVSASIDAAGITADLRYLDHLRRVDV